MTIEKWRQINGLFNEVLDTPDPERRDFIAQKCGDDDNLKLELLTLLEAHEKSENFIEDAAIKIVTKQIVEENNFYRNESLAGKTFDSYKIEKPIGGGGMGEVFLATDEKLNRKVALKILPPQFTADSDKVRRLTLEARAISALNHPNIVTIYDVGSFEDINYIATEYVEGKTLRERLNERLSLKECLEIAIQCCDALAAAHASSIIHRDIKPENIMIRPDGYVKILDFGLAKLTPTRNAECGVRNEKSEMLSEAHPNNPHSAFRTPQLTDPGMVLGTPAYMSPEQASGSNVDKRTDLWNLGIVIYEILTCENPFKKETRRETIQAILTDFPGESNNFQNRIPTELKPVLIKAFQKETDLRYQTAADFKADLLRIKREFDSSSTYSHGSRSLVFQTNSSRYTAFFGFATFFVLTILVGGLIWYFYPNGEETEKIDWTKARGIQLTNQTGTENFPSLAPDGESFVFTAKTKGDFDIFLQRVGGKNAVNLTENFTADDTQPAFSPDGKLIAFRSERDGGGIFVMEATGENPRRVSDFGFYPSWSPDGKYLAIDEKGYDRPEVRGMSSIWIVNIDTGEKRKLTGDRAYQPAWSPKGKRIAFWYVASGGSKREIATISVEGGDIVPVISSANTNWNPVWSPDGKFLYYASDQNGNMAFWRVRIDESDGKILSEAEIVPTPAKFNSHPSFSKDGKRLIYVQSNIQSNLKAVEFDLQNAKPKAEPFSITNGDYEIRRPRLSPDGKYFVFDLARQTQEDIVLMDRSGSDWRDLTNDTYFDRYPVWSPDGKQIAFTSDRAGNHDIWVMNADGSNLRQITSNPNSTTIPVWSPDGKRLVCRHDRIEHIILEFDDAGNITHKKLPILERLFYQDWDWSPDGKKIAGRWNDENTGESGIGYFSLENKEYVKLWTGESTMPQWLPDSQRVIFAFEESFNILDIEKNEFLEIFSLPNETISGTGISRDGSLIYFTVKFTESNIWLLDLR